MLCLYTHTLFGRSHLRTNVTLRSGLMMAICTVLLILPPSSGWPQDSVTSDAWATSAASSGSTSASASSSDEVAVYADTADRPGEQIASIIGAQCTGATGTDRSTGICGDLGPAAVARAGCVAAPQRPRRADTGARERAAGQWSAVRSRVWQPQPAHLGGGRPGDAAEWQLRFRGRCG